MALYYVSAGVTVPAATHASITAVNADAGITSGDTVYFNRAEVFGGATLIGDAGVTYDAYGTGVDPIIDGEELRDCMTVGTASNVTIQNLELIDGVRCLLVSGTGTDLNVNNCVIRGSATNAVTSECVETISTGAGHTYTDLTIYQPNNAATSKGFRSLNNDCILTNVAMVGVAGSLAYNAFELQTCTVALNNCSITNWLARGGATGRLLYAREAVITSTGLTVTDSDGQLYIDDVVGGSDATFDVLNTSGMTGIIQTLVNCTLEVKSGTWDSAFSGVGDSVTISNVNTTETITLNSGLVLAAMTDVAVTGAGIVDSATTSTLTRCSSTGATSSGIAVAVGSTTLYNCSSSTAAVNGLFQTAAAVVVDWFGNYSSNLNDGVSANNTGSVNCHGTTCNLNGDATVSASGDGFTAHDTATFNMYGCVASGNFKSGCGMVGTSTGVIYNCSFYDNYENTVVSNHGIYIDASGGWTIRNCITENHTLEIFVTAAAVLGGVTIDYGCYNNTRVTNAFSWNGTEYNWADYLTNSNQDANSLNADPLFTDKTNYDLSLKAASPCVGTGVTGLGYFVGSDGEPYSSFGVDMGGTMSKHGPFHPVNL